MYDFVASFFSKEQSQKYRLSIQVSLNGFSFSVHDDIDKNVLCLKYLPVKNSSLPLLIRRLEDWFEQDEILKLNYAQKEITFIGSKYYLVPEKLNSKNTETDINKLLFDTTSANEKIENRIEQLSSNLNFNIPKGLQTQLQNSQGSDFVLHHVLNKLLPYFINYTNENSLLLFFDEKDMFLFLKKNGELKICNTYRINHPNDAIYYALTASKSFNVQFDKSKLFLSGKANRIDVVEKNLSNHFSEIRRPEPVQKLNNIDTDLFSKFICLWN